MRYCVMIEGQEGVRWLDWLALARAAEDLGYEGLFTSDHYYSVQGAPDRGQTNHNDKPKLDRHVGGHLNN